MLQNYILKFREALVSQEDKDLMDMAIIKSMVEFFEKSGIDQLKGRVVEVQPLVFQLIIFLQEEIKDKVLMFL